jgi:hypothetical protein
MSKLSNHRKYRKIVQYHDMQATGTNELLLLQLTIFKLNSEAVVHIVRITDFLWGFLPITEN